MRHFAFAVAFVVALVGCPNQTIFPKCDDPKNPCPPVDPDYPASAEGACLHLAELGCSESRVTSAGVTCPMAFRKMEQFTDPHYACVIRARDAAEARACGSVRCIQ